MTKESKEKRVKPGFIIRIIFSLLFVAQLIYSIFNEFQTDINAYVTGAIVIGFLVEDIIKNHKNKNIDVAEKQIDILIVILLVILICVLLIK